MRIISDYQFVEDTDRGATAAIGNFDGVHLGHRSVIELARNAAPEVPLGIVTFDPHPRAYFAPHSAPFQLMSSAARASRLEKLGVEKLYQLPFNTALASLSPFEFADKILHRGLGLRHVVVGADFCFGKGRAGTSADLTEYGQQLGFGVTTAPLMAQYEQTVSSTAIRRALSEGRPRDAAAMLGHWHRIEGPVIGGEQRGRELGYPTANMSIDGLHPPAFGVYAVLADVLEGPHAGSYHGVASMGVRPMFGENKPNLETFIFDFKGDLYGTAISIALVEHLRPEENFDSLEALITQMDADSARARSILAAL
ncbi:bifunctional riboflavin kinase/FAD synthetase [Sulfitobacter sp.]|uniref:bifunctional riboflavin kinase/FAD synthetase n=1 Tax=Sulfitobacter sp. TaxID=1903071 RepID=UPI003299A302